jgi:hypothetical protein
MVLAERGGGLMGEDTAEKFVLDFPGVTGRVLKGG